MAKLRLAVKKNNLFLVVGLTLVFIIILCLIFTKVFLYQFLYIVLIMYYILKVIYFRMFGVFDD